MFHPHLWLNNYRDRKNFINLINISYWMGSRPISLDIGLVLLVFGSSFRLTRIRHRLVQYPVILDGYPSNEKFAAYRTPSIHDHKFMAYLFIKPLDIGQFAI